MKIKIKGYIAQNVWSTQLYFCDTDLSDSSEYTITHRPIEIEVELSSLRFDPSDTNTRDRIATVQTVKNLELEKVDKHMEIEKLNQRIQELMALEAPV